jgi:hypothetical protein
MGWFSEKRGDSRGLSHLGRAFDLRFDVKKLLQALTHRKNQPITIPLDGKWMVFNDAKS